MSVEGRQIEDREEWLAWRREGLGGSDAASVLGLGPFKTPIELWLSKMGAAADPESEAMEFGHRLEPVIADAWESRHEGLRVTKRQLCVVHPERPWMRATIDGVVALEEGEEALWEAKATSGWGWRDGVPDGVLLQLQHNMEVCGVSRCYLAVFRGDGMRLQTEVVERDEEITRRLVEAEEFFWKHYVEPRVCPPAVGAPSEEEALREAFAEADPDLEGIALPEESRRWLTAYREAQEAKRGIDTALRQAKDELMAVLGPYQVGLVDGEVAVTWREVETRRLDQKALRKEDPDLFERYSLISKSRRLVVAGVEED